VANGDVMQSNYYTPLKVTFKGKGLKNDIQYKTVMIIANVVPNLNGGIIIGSDVMKALQITIPYNDEHTATLMVKGESITFQYNNTEKEHRRGGIKKIQVTKSTRPSITMKDSFNSLFFGDKENNRQYIRGIPKELKMQVTAEYNLAMSNPQEYLQKYQYNQPATIPQLVAINCILNEYDVEFCRVSEYRVRVRVRDRVRVRVRVQSWVTFFL